MGKVTVLGIFVADAAFRADRMPEMGETILGNSFALGPGGKGSNQAVAAAKMGAEVAFISALGADAFAQMAHDMWADAGVTPVIREISDSYTGAAFIYVDEGSGDNAIIVSPGAAGLIGVQDIARARGRDRKCRCVHDPVGATDGSGLGGLAGGEGGGRCDAAEPCARRGAAG